jgi:hypothetical protein
MKKANLLVVLVVLFLVASCSNHTQQIMSRTTTPVNVDVISYFPQCAPVKLFRRLREVKRLVLSVKDREKLPAQAVDRS